MDTCVVLEHYSLKVRGTSPPPPPPLPPSPPALLVPMPMTILSQLNSSLIGKYRRPLHGLSVEIDDPVMMKMFLLLILFIDNYCPSAMKSNNDPALLSVMAQLGAGFDCASKEEIKTMVDLGVSPERIIYAHPAKPMSHLK